MAKYIDMHIYGERAVTINGRRYYEADMLDNAPEAVVRCENCVHWDTSFDVMDGLNLHYCPVYDGVTKGDFFCADGER